MPIMRNTFNEGAPGADPGLYESCLTSERDVSLRWWDGALWWDISGSRGSQSQRFKWPKGAAARGIRMPGWLKYYSEKDAMCLRKITNQSKVRWVEKYAEYTPAEVLAYMVEIGVLPKDWKDVFQAEMRDPTLRKGAVLSESRAPWPFPANDESKVPK